MPRLISSSSDEEEGGFLKRSRESSASSPEPVQKRARSNRSNQTNNNNNATGQSKSRTSRRPLRAAAKQSAKTNKIIEESEAEDSFFDESSDTSQEKLNEDSESEFAQDSEEVVSSEDEDFQNDVQDLQDEEVADENDEEDDDIVTVRVQPSASKKSARASKVPASKSGGRRRNQRNNVTDEDDVTIVGQRETEDMEIINEHQRNNDQEEQQDGEPEAQDTQPRRRQRRPRQQARTEPAVPRHEVIFNKMNENLHNFHPDLKTIFDRIKDTPQREPKAIDQPAGIVTSLLPFQREGLNWLIEQEKSEYQGGILADEMGMGKTIQTVGLFTADPPDAKQTLVVTPTVALVQWKNEIIKHTGDSLSVCVYHGQARNKKGKGRNDDGTVSLNDAKIVLTTYAVLESVWRKQQSGFKRSGSTVKEKSALHNIEFHRVVLDEAHSVKDRQSSTARAVFNIKSKYRLCLSGTPLQNRIGEIYSLLRFLQVKPFCEYFCTKCDCRSTSWQFTTSNRCDGCSHVGMQHVNFFNHSLLKRIQRYGYSGPGSEALANLRALLGQIMLRRTKLERADDLGLPPRVVQVRRDFFNEEEKDLYASVYSDSNRRFNTYVNQGVVLNNYANIFTLITRMRQIADHPDLVLRRAEGAGISHGAAAYDKDVCGLCDDVAEDALESKCHHIFCRMCIKEYIEGFTGVEKDLQCPICHVGLTIDLTAPAPEVTPALLATAPSKASSKSIVNRIDMDNWRSSTKIEALVEELYKLRSDNQTIKSIVFSQFTSMLDLVEWRLKKAGFQTVKLQGSMSPAQRDGIIRHFMENHSVEIFLVSLKAGGVALNLCEASQVFILDPWWNPSVEWQSGDRVHRIGQHRPVKITRMVIEDSIESRIVELQEKKANMIHATIGHDDAAMNKLTPADMQFLFMN